VAALDKRTGRLIWSCPITDEGASHSVLVTAELGGVKQYLVHLWRDFYGISTDGKLLWKSKGLPNTYAVTHAPIARADEVFFANGYGSGHFLIRVSSEESRWAIETIYRKKQRHYVPWLGSPTALGHRLYINTSHGMSCLDWKTSKPLWEETTLGPCTYTSADGKLFIRLQSGKVILAAADAKEFRPLAEFSPPLPDKEQPAWTFPVVANGRLYLRNYDRLIVYDVRNPKPPRKKTPDAVFVPTPDDVVAKMLELAQVAKSDVVYDLGSGDGRIVIAAARTCGCRAVGIEIDAGLLTLARERARAARVEKLAAFRHDDLFEADFSDASVVALFILPGMMQKLLPKFDNLKAGSRLVSHAFPIPGIIPTNVLHTTSNEDDVQRPVYLYRVPLTRDARAEQ
jgi:SAM-dependent methyltransferase